MGVKYSKYPNSEDNHTNANQTNSNSNSIIRKSFGKKKKLSKSTQDTRVSLSSPNGGLATISIDLFNVNIPPMEFLNHLAPKDIVHHYMPANLPLYPVINIGYVMECRRSWKRICTSDSEKMKSYPGKQGIVLYYDEFFHRVFKRDMTMQDAFPSLKKRSEVLIRTISFILKTASDTSIHVMHRCRHLGFAHRSYKNVFPQHFAVYVGTLIEVLMYWLDEYATPPVAEAWSNLGGFYLKYVLEAFLFENCDRRKNYQNTKELFKERKDSIISLTNHSNINTNNNNQNNNQNNSSTNNSIINESGRFDSIRGVSSNNGNNPINPQQRPIK